MSEQRTVLIVDDDETIREFVAWALIDEGYNVLSAADGAAALEVLEQERPDLILLDMRMPIMDGQTFADAYRGRPAPRAPFVILTAARSGWDLSKVQGAAGRLEKPFELDDLLAVVARYTQRAS
jgi:CheY-like chemotaxis protein